MVQNNNRIKINLENNPYEVVIGDQILNSIGDELVKLNWNQGTRILVVSNPDVAEPYSKTFLEALHSSGFNPKLLTIKAGEAQKTIATISKIHSAAYEHQLERKSLMIALGGGVVGDMVGFAAATWLRGISFVQVPTTLLAMVDASVGGKTGVNHPKGKNLIGAFHQPNMVLIDINTLKTLPEREFRCGMAEVIKYGVIGDLELFEKLEGLNELNNLNSLNKNMLLEIILRSVKTKARIVEKDEKEKGLRAILNYGHTFGHVVENLSGYGKWLHGEAVSMGMIAAGELSLKVSFWSEDEAKRQKLLLEKACLPTKWPKLDHNDVIKSLKGDKKVQDDNIRFILPNSIGNVEISNDIDNQTIIEILEFLERD